MQHQAGKQKCTPVAGRTQPIFRIGLIPHATRDFHQTIPQQKNASHQTCTVTNVLAEVKASLGCLQCTATHKSLSSTAICIVASEAAYKQEAVACLYDSCCASVFHLPYVLERVSASGDTFESVRRPDISRTSRPAAFASRSGKMLLQDVCFAASEAGKVRTFHDLPAPPRHPIMIQYCAWSFSPAHDLHVKFYTIARTSCT